MTTVRTVPRFVTAALACAVFVPTAHAAPPSVSAQAAPPRGPAPLTTTLTAAGDAASYRWELPGGATATGASLTYTFPAGKHVVGVVATSATGETARAAVTVVAMTLSLDAPRVAGFGERVRLSGRLWPSFRGRVTVLRNGQPITSGRLRDAGRFRVGVRPRAPGSYTVRYGNVVSRTLAVAIRPSVGVRLDGTPVVGMPLAAVVRVRPAAAGAVTLRVLRDGREWRRRTGKGTIRLPLDTSRVARYVVAARLAPSAGYTGAAESSGASVRLPTLAVNSRGPSVYALEQRLVELSYALPQVDGFYGWETFQAVLAFQKLHGLAASGKVDARLWRRLETARRPRARYGGDHIEVDKGRQLLLLVRNGQVVLTSHVSTGATGNTPVGRWRVYRKVVGWDWVLWYPMYFLRGFAIHGYPEVPAYPASHGCVRVPMWLAPRLFAQNGYGTLVYVY